jgi:phospholipase/lecithinase/hemolysin
MAAGGGGGLWLRWPILLGAVLVAASGGGEQSLRAAAAAPAVPALFVFGDSLIDSGNNNNLASLAKANYFPYGIDFDGGPTGRFSNGYTIVDELGTYVSVRVVLQRGKLPRNSSLHFPQELLFLTLNNDTVYFSTLSSLN